LRSSTHKQTASTSAKRVTNGFRKKDRIYRRDPDSEAQANSPMA
jgi:hypothetical protein